MTRSHHPHRAQAAGRPTPALTPVAAACSVLMLLSSQAFAQATATADTQSVTVTGIRKGIEDAISVKRNSDSIVESISAEDIGKLPDASVAESISRLPGVTAQRNKSSGKAQQVSVRGMSPDFNGALLNGREQASSGDSRGVEFDLYPSELLGGVTIYKTPDARLVGQGLASTIDQQTVMPLNFAKRTVAVNYRKQRTGVGSGAGEGSGDRASLSYIDQFADRTVGVALGLTQFKEDGAAQQKFNSWGGWAPLYDTAAGTMDTCNKPNGAPDSWTPPSTCAKTIGGFTSDVETATQRRQGAMAVLQYKPSKNFETVLDIFYSKGDFGLKKTGLEGAIAGSAGPYDPAGVLSNYTVSNGVITSGTFNNYKGVVRNHVEGGDDKLTSWGWKTNGKIGDWTALADIAQSKVTRNSTRYETTAGLAGNASTLDTISYSGFNGNNFDAVKYSTGLNYADRNVVKLTDVDGWSGGASSPQAGYVALPTVTDKIDAIRLAASRDMNLGPITKTEFGINVTERDKVREAIEGRLMIAGGNPYGTATVPGSGTAIAGTTGLPVVSWDPNGSLGSIYTLASKVDKDILNKNWSVGEKVRTAYVKSDLDTEVAGITLRGNVGGQMVRTNQTSTGYEVSTNACTGNTPETCPATSASFSKAYWDFLPSLNLVADVGGDQVVRFGLAKVLARPNMGDMRASSTVSYDATKNRYSVDAGNPNLEPFRAKAVDISYEKYFGKKGYVSVAGFYKQLDTYILKTSDTIAADTSTGRPAIDVTMPRNGAGGSIRGVELAVNVPFSLFTPMLDGFGVVVNTSATNSSVTLPKSAFSTTDVGTANIPLPGLSKNVTNMRVYYEKHGFQVALASRTRSDFLGEISDFQDNRQLTYIKGETIVDLQAAYEFDTGPMKGLSLLLQANNLTKADFVRYSTTPDNVVERIKTGKTYLFGANYKF